MAHHQDVIYCHSSVTKIKHNQALIKMGLDCSTRKPPDPSHDNGGKRMKGNFPLAQFFTANWVTSNKRTPSPNKEHPHGFNARYLLQSTVQKEPWNGKPENLILVPIQALALDLWKSQFSLLASFPWIKTQQSGCEAF